MILEGPMTLWFQEDVIYFPTCQVRVVRFYVSTGPPRPRPSPPPSPPPPLCPSVASM